MTSPRHQQITLHTGDQAPAFELPAWPGGSVSSAELLRSGALLLVFYASDVASSSLKTLRSLSENAAAFAEQNCRIGCLSFDDVDAHARTAAANGISQALTLLSDTSHDTARAYGAVIGDRNLPEPMVFVVDKHGVIRHIEEDWPGIDVLMQAVQALSA